MLRRPSRANDGRREKYFSAPLFRSDAKRDAKSSGGDRPEFTDKASVVGCRQSLAGAFEQPLNEPPK